MSEKVFTRVEWDHTKAIELKDKQDLRYGKYGVNWNDEGVIKLMQSKDDFIFKSESVHEALERLQIINNRNPGLIKSIKCGKSVQSI